MWQFARRMKNEIERKIWINLLIKQNYYYHHYTENCYHYLNNDNQKLIFCSITVLTGNDIEYINLYRLTKID